MWRIGELQVLSKINIKPEHNDTSKERSNKGKKGVYKSKVHTVENIRKRAILWDKRVHKGTRWILWGTKNPYRFSKP